MVANILADTKSFMFILKMSKIIAFFYREFQYTIDSDFSLKPSIVLLLGH